MSFVLRGGIVAAAAARFCACFKRCVSAACAAAVSEARNLAGCGACAPAAAALRSASCPGSPRAAASAPPQARPPPQGRWTLRAKCRTRTAAQRARGAGRERAVTRACTHRGRCPRGWPGRGQSATLSPRGAAATASRARRGSRATSARRPPRAGLPGTTCASPSKHCSRQARAPPEPASPAQQCDGRRARQGVFLATTPGRRRRRV